MTTTPPPNGEVDVSNGYYQIVVPNFGAATPALPAGAKPSAAPVPLSSFLRLGIAGTTAAGAEPDPPSTFGPQLLGVALASSPIAAGNLYEDGFVDQNANALTPTVAAGSQTLPIFADDIRDQGADNNANGLTVAQRAAESALLLTKGGWRDHTDGNRISTTYGDKVEVIRGNYKLVVLGRQDNAGNGHTTESSGGMFQDNDLAPGQVTEISWVETQGGTWRVVETCTKGDVDTTFDGKVVERFVGGSVTSIVGKESKATATSALAGFTDATAATSTDPTISRMYLEYQDALANAYVDASVTFTEYVTQRGYSTDGGGSNLDFTHLEAGGSNPYVLEQTWASRIESYTGSEITPVPTIIETTWATNITGETYASSISESVGSAAHPVGTITETVHAASISETVDAATINEIKTVSGTITETTTAPLTTQTYTGALIDNHFGFKWENIFGAWGRIAVGVSAEIFIGVGAEINIGPALEVNLGLAVSIATTTLDIAITTIENKPTEIELKDVKLKTIASSIGSFGFYCAV